MKSPFVALFMCAVALPALANPAAGDACAQKLTPDSKKIYDQVIASKPTQANAQDVTATVTRDLAQRNAIDGRRGLNSALDSMGCTTAYLK